MEGGCPNAYEPERTFHLYHGMNICSACLGMYILPNDIGVMNDRPEETNDRNCRLPNSYYSQEVGGIKDIRMLVIDVNTEKPVGVTGWNGSAHYGGKFMTDNDGTYRIRIVTRNMPVLVCLFPNGGFHHEGTAFRAGFGSIESEPFRRANPPQSLHILLLRPTNAASFAFMGMLRPGDFAQFRTGARDIARPRRMPEAEFQPGREIVAPVRLSWGTEMGAPDPIGDMEILRNLIGEWWEEEHSEQDRERILRLLQNFDTEIRTIIQ